MARIGEITEVTNHGRKFGSWPTYPFLYALRNGKVRKYMLTEEVLDDAERRAEANPEDLPPYEEGEFTAPPSRWLYIMVAICVITILFAVMFAGCQPVERSPRAVDTVTAPAADYQKISK